MEELIQIISKLLEYENLPEIVNYNEDKDGKVTITFETSKKNDPEIKKIKEELDSMEDPLFEEVTTLFKKEFPKSFEILSTLSNPKDISAIKLAYEDFKKSRNKVVYRIVNKLKMDAQECTKQAETLTRTYLQ